MLFEISGYWKDDKSEFTGLLTSSTHDMNEEEDDSIFFYGLCEEDIRDAIAKGEDTVHDFVITSYEEVSWK